MSGADAALLEELRLRSRLNALVHEQAEALREADRLTARGSLDGADPGMAQTAERWRTVASEVAAQIGEQRAALRKQEAEVARLRAPGGPSGDPSAPPAGSGPAGDPSAPPAGSGPAGDPSAPPAGPSGPAS